MCTYLALMVLAASMVAVTCRPNIIFILTDDQDVALGSFTPMEKTKSLIGDEGVTFENAFVTTPICCPSRSSILTGTYVYNHLAINNSLSGGCSSEMWQRSWEPVTYGAALFNAGYKTFYAGKYLNEYGYKHSGGTEHVPVGWDWWVGLVGNSIYYNYTLSVNGTAVDKGDAEEDYLTDVLKAYSLDFLNQKHITESDRGFLMAINTPSAHAPFTPAKRHAGRFSEVRAPRTPNFNTPVDNTKHWLTRMPPEVLPVETLNALDEVYRNRWETLMAVDEIVEAIVLQLDKLGILNNTYIIFSSDHGFHFGQFGLVWDKRNPYETDIRIPLLMRGPNVPRNKTILNPVLSIDIAPTILDIAGVSPINTLDGESFLSLFNDVSHSFDRTFLVEYYGEGTQNEEKLKDCYDDLNLTLCSPDISCKCFDVRNNTYKCTRQLSNTVNSLFCSFSDDEHFTELYDLNADPYQLKNLAFPTKTDTALKYEAALSCFDTLRTKDSMFSCLANTIQ